MELLNALQGLLHFLLNTKAGVYVLGFAVVLGVIIVASKRSHIIANTLGWILLLSGVIVTFGSIWGFVTSPPRTIWLGYMIAGLVPAAIGRHIMEAYGAAPPPPLAPQQQMPVPQPYSPYPNAGNATAAEAMRNFGGNPPRRGLDQQNSYD